MEILEISWNF